MRKKKSKHPKSQDRKFPSLKQWKGFLRILNKKESITFLILLVLFVVSLVYSGVGLYLKNTSLAPAFGGEYKEGIVGQPMSLNPLRLSSQDVDRDLVEVLFSGLLKYDENGGLINDLAESYETLSDEKSIEVYLRKDLFWHDGTPLTIDDVMFTLNLIQDPQYQSPWRIKFLGIAADEISGGGVKFTLPKKYGGFLENLTFKILPKHIFQDIATQNWPKLITKEYLVGSGPFILQNIAEGRSGYIKSMSFSRNENYYAQKPYLEKVTFLFYKTPEDLLRAAKLGEVYGFAPTDISLFDSVSKSSFKEYLISIPRYFSLFFNVENKNVFSALEMKQALSLSVNKTEIIKNVFSGNGKAVSSPILPEFFNFNNVTSTLEYNKAEAEQILEEHGFILNEETGKRAKNNIIESNFSFTKNLTLKNQNSDVTELQKCLAKDKEVYPEGVISGYFGVKTKVAVINFQEKYKQEILVPAGLSKGNGEVKPLTRQKLNEICFEKETEIIPLTLTITTSNKFPLMEIAKSLKTYWEDIGISVVINEVSLSELQTETLANRDFESLLFGEALSSIPDPFPFWHSSQKDHPGLNISSYNSKKADTLLESAREAKTEETRKENLEAFQNEFFEELPAILLVRPNYTYMLSGSIGGYNVQKITEPSKRFSTIENWYIKTKRILK